MRLSDLLTEKRERESTGVSSLDNLLESVTSNFPNEMNTLPISPTSSDWVTLSSPTRLAKSFEFKNSKSLKYFINELISYQELKNHHALVKIDVYNVIVESYTHDVDNVTNLDISLAKFCDEIFEDTRFFNK